MSFENGAVRAPQIYPASNLTPGNDLANDQITTRGEPSGLPPVPHREKLVNASGAVWGNYEPRPASISAADLNIWADPAVASAEATLAPQQELSSTSATGSYETVDLPPLYRPTSIDSDAGWQTITIDSDPLSTPSAIDASYVVDQSFTADPLGAANVYPGYQPLKDQTLDVAQPVSDQTIIADQVQPRQLKSDLGALLAADPLFLNLVRDYSTGLITPDSLMLARTFLLSGQANDYVRAIDAIEYHWDSLVTNPHAQSINPDQLARDYAGIQLSTTAESQRNLALYLASDVALTRALIDKEGNISPEKLDLVSRDPAFSQAQRQDVLRQLTESYEPLLFAYNGVNIYRIGHAGGVDLHSVTSIETSEQRRTRDKLPIRPGGEKNEITLPEAEKFFFTQFAHPKWNKNGKPRSEDCGPASLAMAMKYFGKAPPGHDLRTSTDEDLINASRVAMTGRLKNEGTDTQEVLKGARVAGLKANNLHSFNEVDTALDAGRMVVLTGSPGGFTRDLHFNANDYATNGKGGLFNGPHSILVVSGNGKDYVVNDPACKRGPIKLTKAQLLEYFRGPGGGGAVAVGV